MPMYNLTEYGDNYLKASGTLSQYDRDKPTLTAIDDIDDFNAVNTTTNLFKTEAKTGAIGNNSTKDVAKIVPLKYSRNFWRTREMSLIYCEFNVILTWFAYYVILSTTITNQAATFTIADTKPYVLAVIFSTQDNAKFLEQLKSGFKKQLTEINFDLK